MTDNAVSDSPIRTLRKRLGLTQIEFWQSIGVLQANGSRYEAGINRTPKYVALLIEIAYGDEDTAELNMRKLRNRKKK